MTGAELTSRLLKKLGEDPTAPKFFTAAHALTVLNEAQQLFVLLTLCLETECNIAISPGVYEYDASATRADWLVCLSMRRGVDARKVQPCTIDDMAARNPAWQATSATAPERYAVAGFSMLYMTPQPAALGTVTAVYARGPSTITDIGSAETPEEYQHALLAYGQVRLRLHQGAQLLANDIALLGNFFDDVKRCSNYVRSRSLDKRYDVLPAELKLPDFSRVLKGIVQMAPVAETRPNKATCET